MPFGPCGYEELTQFSKAPSLIEYQILLVDADCSYHITSFGPPAPDKLLILLHEKGHYDVITSLLGYLNSSYVCSHCFKPYNTEGRHRCKFKIQCRCCLQKDCPDFHYAHPRGLKPLDVVTNVDRTFSETRVSKPIKAKPTREKPLRSISAASASIDVDAWAVASWKWD